ncbi:nuclear transport factor 2 family protein [Paraconexibacter sp.]|uniref:nuclear transport factor 2 family protein n=1 Tax=Paraconexibacter sp. TaxID=2949640 RepID=UPI00356A91B7
MSITAFRDAVVAHDHAALVETLSPEVTFCSPAVHKPYEGRDATAFILAGVLQVFEDFRYVDELIGDGKATLRFRARVGDRELEGVDLLTEGDDGLISELTVLIRPLSGLQAVVAGMEQALREMQSQAEPAT